MPGLRCYERRPARRDCHFKLTMLELKQLAKRYGETTVFEGVDLSIAAGEFVAILGESGVGKSTLLNCIAGLDSVDAGSVAVAGTRLDSLDEGGQALLRRRHLGFVFQAFHLLPHLSVAQNVGLPLMLIGLRSGADFDDRIARALSTVGLEGFGPRLPQTLSGGQLQRVAIARAMIHRPQLILADEPTGNLDAKTAERILDLLVEQVRGQNSACVLVTHSHSAAQRADRMLELTAGGIRPARQ